MMMNFTKIFFIIIILCLFFTDINSLIKNFKLNINKINKKYETY